ncbi:FAD-dependent monooxygenase [Rhodoblastus sp.]|uniref:FAD-dependent monooxygenase n=1 Tax=Rhodoblastus sp. TaxID=1962975 RepID=UPI0026144995|nr:FAD-dependent monooxygenase [Rhodoblastus sp.]
MTSREPFVIAGGGVGGLTVALALAQIGRRVLLFERAPAFREVGAGLQLSPNACRVLRRLGVLDSLMDLAVAPRFVRLRRNSDGADLARVPLDDAESRWGAPYIGVHRADLLAALVDRARANDLIEITNDSTLTGFIQDERGVAVTFRFDGEFRRASGAALIGADGVRSMVRSRMFPGEADKPVYTGHTAWRTILPAAKLPDAFRAPVANLWFGDRAHLVHYPLRAGSIVNVVALVEDAWRGETENDPDFWDTEGDRRFLLNRFKDWAGEARSLIGAGETWMRWPLFDRPSLDAWTRGRVALLGDAAHPMLPYLAQGAAQAIEDAAALSAAVAENQDDPAAALSFYSAARAFRARKIQEAARAQGEIYHLGGVKAFMRDVALRLSPSGMLRGRQDWIYSA